MFKINLMKFIPKILYLLFTILTFSSCSEKSSAQTDPPVVLTDDEIIRCCEIYAELGADFVKTSTGYAEKGATLEAVQLMRKHLPSNIQIKASGGIRNFAFAKQLVEAGANRLGCSASVAIVKESLNH